MWYRREQHWQKAWCALIRGFRWRWRWRWRWRYAVARCEQGFKRMICLHLFQYVCVVPLSVAVSQPAQPTVQFGRAVPAEYRGVPERLRRTDPAVRAASLPGIPGLPNPDRRRARAPGVQRASSPGQQGVRRRATVLQASPGLRHGPTPV